MYSLDVAPVLSLSFSTCMHSFPVLLLKICLCLLKLYWKWFYGSRDHYFLAHCTFCFQTRYYWLDYTMFMSYCDCEEHSLQGYDQNSWSWAFVILPDTTEVRTIQICSSPQIITKSLCGRK
jgi:hypothetical protein